MDCPECGGPVDDYVLRGREAPVCGRCGWVGIEADHRGTGLTDESWDEALGRFYERRTGTARRADLPPVSPSAAESTPGGPSDGALAADGADPPDADADGGPAGGEDRAVTEP